jgi:hypothetical protein
MPIARSSLPSLLSVITLLVAPNGLGAQRTWHPTFTALSPSIVQHGSNLTISGSDLNPPGWQRRLIYPQRYAGVIQVVLSSSSNSTQIVIAADKDMRGDSVRVQWFALNDSLTTANPIPTSERTRFFPAEFVVQAAPDVTFEGTLLTADIGPNFRIMAVTSNGQGILKGKYLRRQVMPMVTFAGTTQSAIAHTYEPQGVLDHIASCCASGADRVVFAAPTQHASGWLVLDNSLGRDSGAVTFALPPAPTQVVMQTSTGTAPLSPANTFQRGRTYVVRGQHLSITHTLGGTTSIKRGMALLGGTSITPSFASDTNIVFTVPTSFASSSAALTVSTSIGTATMGTFSIVNPVVPIDVVSVTPSTLTITAGKPIVVVATLNIPGGVKDGLGNLILTTPGSPVGSLKFKSAIAVTGPSTEVKFEGGDIEVTTPVTLVIAHESNGVNGITTQTQQVAITVRPPHPIQVRGGPTVTAGSAALLDVVFDSSTRSSSPIFALISSSNPNVVAVPASATISGNGARIVATVPPVQQAGGTTTITATLDGASASLPLTVVLPQVQQLTLNQSTALPGSAVDASAVLNGALSQFDEVSFTSSDTVLQRESDRYAIDAARTTATNRFRVSRAVIGTHQVTVTATYKGTSKTATVTVNPIAISSFTATPTAGAGGATITATALLTSQPGIGMLMEFASADTMRATVNPATSDVTGSTTSKVVSILLKGPVSTPRQVPITATLHVPLPNSSGLGPIVSTQTIVVTVNP